MNKTEQMMYSKLRLPKELVTMIFSYIVSKWDRSVQIYKKNSRWMKHERYLEHRAVLLNKIYCLKILRDDILLNSTIYTDATYYILDDDCKLTGKHIRENPRIIRNRIEILVNKLTNT